MSGRYWIEIGAALAALAVAAGAFGAHGLKGKLEPAQLESFETAVRYQMYHALALVLVGLMLVQSFSAVGQAAGIAFVLGTALFSGGIYAWLATAVKPLVHVVPVGGSILIVGWVLLAVAAARWKG